MPQQKPSIVHIIDCLNTGGAERVLVTLANIFFQRGHRIKVITIVEKGPLAEQLLPGIEQVNLGRKFKFDPLVMHRLIKQTKDFDVVHVHSFFNLRYVWLAKTLFGLNKPIFFHEHLGLREQLPATNQQKYILPKTVFISTTAGIASWAATKAQVPANRVFILPNIVLKEEVAAAEKKGAGSFNLVLVSNIKPEKNIIFAINLLQQLNTKGRYHLTIIGKIYDDAYYNNLQQQAVETGTTDAITFITDANKVQQLLPQFDMGLHTSPSESGPLAVIEYIAQGLPFVAYNTGEVIKLIEQELNEAVAYSFDITEWAQKIQQLRAINTHTMQHQLQAVFSRHFSAEAYYRQCLNIYEKGIGIR